MGPLLAFYVFLLVYFMNIRPKLNNSLFSLYTDQDLLEGICWLKNLNFINSN